MLPVLAFGLVILAALSAEGREFEWLGNELAAGMWTSNLRPGRV